MFQAIRDLPIYHLSLKKIKEVEDPFAFCPWGYRSPISAVEIGRALAEYKFNKPKRTGISDLFENLSRQKRIQRMAWLAGFGWQDPIRVDMIKSYCFRVLDGQHRLRAAYVRGDETIAVQFAEALDPNLSLSVLEYLQSETRSSLTLRV